MLTNCKHTNRVIIFSTAEQKLPMAAAQQDITTTSSPSFINMVSAFLSMEPPHVVISFAKELGCGSITETVQSSIWQHCVNTADVKMQGPYLKTFVKKLIFEIESNGGVVLDELYEQCACYMISLKDHVTNGGSNRVLKTISFIYPNGSSGNLAFRKTKKLEVRLQCSVNMLEGDTGCSIWPSSLFLSEFILSYPEIFRSKCCFELGSGVGLAGICLAHVEASKVLLSDGDLLTLANLKVNLELNHLNTGNHLSDDVVNNSTVQCVCLPWESASMDDLHRLAPDIVLGADIIYDPACLPHLVRVLSILLNHRNCPHPEVRTELDVDAFVANERNTDSPSTIKRPVAYIASVVRNIDTYNYFHALANQAKLVITDITQKVETCNFLLYLKSYNRSSIRMLRIHV